MLLLYYFAVHTPLTWAAELFLSICTFISYWLLKEIGWDYRPSHKTRITLRSHIMPDLFHQCFLRIICVSSISVNSTRNEKSLLLLLPAPFFRKRVLQHSVIVMSEKARKPLSGQWPHHQPAVHSSSGTTLWLPFDSFKTCGKYNKALAVNQNFLLEAETEG